MLVLSRKCGQKVIIDGDIEVTVLEISRDKVRLGFVAPKEVAIKRDDLKKDPDHDAAAKKQPAR